MKNIEFVSYSGRYPNLCSGTLVLNIDRVEHSFNNCFQPKCAVFFTETQDVAVKSPWELNITKYGDEIAIGIHIVEEYSRVFNKPEVTFTEEEIKAITDIVNKNVPWGCCGGCL